MKKFKKKMKATPAHWRKSGGHNYFGHYSKHKGHRILILRRLDQWDNVIDTEIFESWQKAKAAGWKHHYAV